MEFLCYHRDRSGSTALRTSMVEQHWSFMDGYADRMIARGPTFDGETLTGSVHVLDLPDPAAARAFVFDEPCYQAGAYRDVLLRRWRGSAGTTMWEHPRHGDDVDRYLVLGFLPTPTTAEVLGPRGADVIVGGLLLSDDGARVLGAAALLVADSTAQAAAVLDAGRYDGVEVHRWRPGGRPAA